MADINSKEGLRDSMGTEGSGDFRNRLSSVASDLNERYHVRDRFQNVVGRFQEDRRFMYAGLGVLGIGLGFGAWALYRYFSERSSSDEYIVAEESYTV